MQKILIKLTPTFILLTLIVVSILSISSFWWIDLLSKHDVGLVYRIDAVLIGLMTTMIIFYGYLLARLASGWKKFSMDYIKYLKAIINISLIIFIDLILTLVLIDFNLIVLAYLIFIGVFGMIMVVLRELFRKAYELQVEIDHTI